MVPRRIMAIKHITNFEEQFPIKLFMAKHKRRFLHIKVTTRIMVGIGKFMGHIIMNIERYSHIKLLVVVGLIIHIIQLVGVLIGSQLLNIRLFLRIFLMGRIRYIYPNKPKGHTRFFLNIFLQVRNQRICLGKLMGRTQSSIQLSNSQLFFFLLGRIQFFGLHRIPLQFFHRGRIQLCFHL
jgi:hypothetical protein